MRVKMRMQTFERAHDPVRRPRPLHRPRSRLFYVAVRYQAAERDQLTDHTNLYIAHILHKGRRKAGKAGYPMIDGINPQVDLAENVCVNGLRGDLGFRGHGAGLALCCPARCL